MRAAFYEADITPPLGCSIPGYFIKRIGNDVWNPLYAKAAVFSDGNEKIAFLMLDMLFVYTDERDRIYDRIEMHTDLKRENIIIFATHTHSGIDTQGLWGEKIYKSGRNEGFMRSLVQKTADAIIRAYENRKNGRLLY